MVDLLCEELDQHSERLKRVVKQLQAFAKQAPIAEQEARAVLESMPCVGLVTIEVVLAEAGDIRRFGSQRKATAYAGLAPGIRESAGKAKQLGITKQGSRLLRTTLVETAWRLVTQDSPLGKCVRKTKSPLHCEEGDRGRGSPCVVRDGLDVAERAEVSTDVRKKKAPSSPPRKPCLPRRIRSSPAESERRAAPPRKTLTNSTTQSSRRTRSDHSHRPHNNPGRPRVRRCGQPSLADPR